MNVYINELTWRNYFMIYLLLDHDTIISFLSENPMQLKSRKIPPASTFS